ncbi:helix-turn-helix domain-containing protein [uncultured Enterococcus sp.]|uniref:helix-turn-helix domain-containing protein n=1 Tax=uncultured Enterococcus sp. TaxID=167972 RepID=UPI00262D912D|nr:helix-turn-helix transcriptional regulator [uncultured Enterococcus sp.]
MELANNLKYYREKAGFTQEEVANELRVTWQSISRWENGKSYPDLDNLVLISELYQVSIDHLIKENEELFKKIDQNAQEIQDKKQKLREIEQEVLQITSKEKDESLLLLLLAAVSSLIFPLGLLLIGFVLIRNKRQNRFYKLIWLVALIVLFINVYSGIGIVGDYLGWGEVHIEKIE